jgi:hypothetical protein
MYIFRSGKKTLRLTNILIAKANAMRFGKEIIYP